MTRNPGLAVLLTLAALASGCAPDSVTPDGVPDTLYRGGGLEPETLDPHVARSVETFHILRDMYEGLIAEDADGELVPGIAESWMVSNDGLVWTFRLRPDARWSNGDPLTATDVAWSLQRAVDPDTGSYYAPMLAVIEQVETPDLRTVRITLNGPTPYLLGLLAQPISFPVHRATVEEHGDRFTRPQNAVSNGAYRITEWVTQSHIRLERNDHYWNDINTAIDNVVYLPIETESTELARYRAGDLHITRTIPNPQYEWLQRNLPDELFVTPYLSTYFYGLNLMQPPFAGNPALREALSLAVDRQVIAEQVTGAGEVPAYSWVPPGIHNYTSQQLEWADWTQEERNERARALYREAGYSESEPLEIELRYNTAESHQRIAAAISSMWRETLGVQTTLVNEEWQVFLQNRVNGRLQVYRSGWVGDYNDANTFAEAMLHGHGLNDMGWQNDEYERLVREAGRTTDGDERRRMLEEAERLMLSEHPMIPLYFYVSKALVKPEVAGYRSNVMNVHPSRHIHFRSR
jgi:oligopeptide transport system substrate-binding protein